MSTQILFRTGRVIAFLLSIALVQASAAEKASLGDDSDIDHAIAALRKAKTYYVEVSQKYDNAPDVSLPFADVISAWLRPAGLTLAKKAADADVVWHIDAEGQALTRVYRTTLTEDENKQFAGAEVSGTWKLSANGKAVLTQSFSGRIDPPDLLMRDRTNATDAPFTGAFGDFVEEISTISGKALGAKPAIAILNLDEGDPLQTSAPQLQRCAAELVAHDKSAGAGDLLLQVVQSSVPNRRAAGAKGIRLLGLDSAVPILIDMLDEPDRAHATPYNTQNVAVELTEALDSGENDDGLLDPRAEILLAIQALHSPEKVKLLIAALQIQDSPARRVGAALLLADAGPEGFPPLLKAAKDDDDELVRAAAINAIAKNWNARAIPVLQEISKREEQGPDAIAAANVLEEKTGKQPTPEPSGN